ncbi:unnamed protein product [Pseudo-nitzschia multistriata]|uniref:Acyl-coenzyme A thioesterase THEM4 n=1 Tax=Pseudo-nitzschia multistriata TaxID=183589 RepID=A0A448ZED0_9STRA|nr:unnamed protein product [Pseudo-nitzschia multistriata]
MWQRTRTAAGPWIGVLCAAAIAAGRHKSDGTPSESQSTGQGTHRTALAEALSPVVRGLHGAGAGAVLFPGDRPAPAFGAPLRARDHPGGDGEADQNHPPTRSRSSPLLLATSSASPRRDPLATPGRGTAPGHAIFGTLWGGGAIERYDVYRPASPEAARETAGERNRRETEREKQRLERRGKSKSKSKSNNHAKSKSTTDHEELVVEADVRFGTRLNGHTGIVHGGILSLVFDDLMGFACDEMRGSGVPRGMPVTANLSVDFRAPVPEGTAVKVEIFLERREGRKLFWKAYMLGDNDDDDDEILYAEATSLYILVGK